MIQQEQEQGQEEQQNEQQINNKIDYITESYRPFIKKAVRDLAYKNSENLNIVMNISLLNK